MSEILLEISVIENSVMDTIKNATYDPDLEIDPAASLMSDLSIDSLEMQVIFQQLSAEYGVAIKIKEMLTSVNGVIDSVLAADEKNYDKILDEITRQTGLSFTAEDQADFAGKKEDNQNRNLMVRCILEYITVCSIANCILFLRGA